MIVVIIVLKGCSNERDGEESDRFWKNMETILERLRNGYSLCICEGNARSLEWKGVEYDGDNVEHMWEQAKRAMLKG